MAVELPSGSSRLEREYEVLLLAHAADDNCHITLWPYYLVPDAV
jgi:hypothetical protein